MRLLLKALGCLSQAQSSWCQQFFAFLTKWKLFQVSLSRLRDKELKICELLQDRWFNSDRA